MGQRRNLLRAADELSKSLAVDRPSDAAVEDQIGRLAERILAARGRGAAVMLAYGAHLIKNGAGPLINRLIEAGLVSHLATQGAGIIHDWEFAFQGESGESVRENAPAGRSAPGTRRAAGSIWPSSSGPPKGWASARRWAG